MGVQPAQAGFVAAGHPAGGFNPTATHAEGATSAPLSPVD